MLFLWCKAEFSSLLQFSVSHDLLEITIYLTQETFLIIINVENNFAASYFVKMVIHYFSRFFDKYKV